MIEHILESERWQIVISIVLGLGLAALFQQACSGDNCLIIKGPPMQEIEKYYYKIDNECFKYKHVPTKCTTDEK